MPIADKLLPWYDEHGRHDLPWQVSDPYVRWISEIMLQQTQVATVIPYFKRFIARFPDVGALAAADEDQVLALWQGLGYYSRARNLHRAARQVVDDYGGVMPLNPEALLGLPGIGRSTAAAILAQSIGERHAILDGNVKRVLARMFAVDGDPSRRETELRLWALAEQETPDKRVADYTQAIMDLGATVCRRQPLCGQCPLVADCKAHGLGRQQDYPQKRAKKTIPERATTMLWIEDAQGRVLLQRREGPGVWQGLWTPPMIDTDADPLSAVLARVPDAEYIGDDEPFTHVFSHYRLHIRVSRWRCASFVASLAEDDRWLCYDPDVDHEIGLPRPVERLFQRKEREL